MSFFKKSISHGSLIVLIFKEYDRLYTSRDQLLKSMYAEYNYKLSSEQEDVLWELAEYFLSTVLTFHSYLQFDGAHSANAIAERAYAHYYIYHRDVRGLDDGPNSWAVLSRKQEEWYDAYKPAYLRKLASSTSNSLENIANGAVFVEVGVDLETQCETFAQIATDYLRKWDKSIPKKDIEAIDEIAYKHARIIERIVATKFSGYKKITW